jgi:hypothetical protein
MCGDKESVTSSLILICRSTTSRIPYIPCCYGLHIEFVIFQRMRQQLVLYDSRNYGLDREMTTKRLQKSRRNRFEKERVTFL